MHEIVHLSHGPQANYLNTLFYNCQQNYFVYRDDQVARSLVDPSVRFVAGKEYTPRAAFWDFRNGFGNLGKTSRVYEQIDSKQDILTQNGAVEVPATLTPAGSYWTDYLKVRVHPQSKHEIPGWEFDPELAPYGQVKGHTEGMSFATFDQGVDEYRQAEVENSHEYLDLTVRRIFEQCDSLAGINMLTDMTGWGGWTAAMLEPLRDDYASKVPIFSWAMSSARLKQRVTIDSHLETILALNEYSDLVIPIATDANQSFLQNAQRVNLLFETICLNSSLRQSRLSMREIADDLTIGTSAKIVSGSVAGSSLRLPELKTKRHIEACTGFLRSVNEPLSKAQQSEIWDTRFQEEAKVSAGTAEHKLHRHFVPQSLPTAEFEGYDSNYVYADLTLDEGVRNLESLVGPNYDLRTRVLDMTQEYSWTWQDSDDDYN